ncbi:longitudinals lacking protein, isoforms H/M/V [Anopheles gambiae]|uniref:longitudinals lacking protein, isoforms H/M/V-like n=1 Tax=Anopheles coluzzii TaxID=1518534 RepID=UPI0020FFADAE|nr:longitudinals lacking protein, isoforms H/M/V-like [Anopheles coluzzii]XP_061504771.1 longitudinals lacking protein, isoforms H/M/V [Anopheles gambiae]
MQQVLWKKHFEELYGTVKDILHLHAYEDCTIVCEGELFRAHRFLLASVSPYFHKIFSQNETNTTVVLKDVSPHVMRIIMQFLYYGEATIFDGDLENVVAAAEHLDLIPVVAMLRNLGKEQQPAGHHRSAASYLGYDAIAPDQAATPPRLSVRSQYMAPHNRKRIAPDSDDEQLPERLSPVELTMAASRDLRDPSGAGAVQTPTSPQQHRPQATNPPPEQLSPGLQEGQASLREPDLPLATREATDSPHTTSQSSSVDERDKLWSYYDSVGLKLLTDSAQSTPLADADKRKATAGRAIVGSAGKSAPVTPGEKWYQGKLQFMLSQRGKPLLVHDGHSFGIQYIRKDKKYWQCNLSRKYNCKARVTTTDTGDIIVTNNEHCHTEIRQHLRKDYKTMKLAASLAANRGLSALPLLSPKSLTLANAFLQSTGAVDAASLCHSTSPNASHQSEPAQDSTGSLNLTINNWTIKRETGNYSE